MVLVNPILEICGGGVATAATSALVLLSGGGGGGVDAGIFHRITMTSMTGAWYLTINNFEAIIVGLIILEIFVLRYLLILPFDLTKWFHQGVLIQSAVSRRRKRSSFPVNAKELEEGVRLMDTMITAVRRLDKEDCLLKALCVLEGGRCGGGSSNSTLPPSVIRTLVFLKGFKPPLPSQEDHGNIKLTSTPPVMSQLQSAVLHGANNTTTRSSGGGGGGGCDHAYPKCTLSPEEINIGLQIYLGVLNNSE